MDGWDLCDGGSTYYTLPYFKICLYLLLFVPPGLFIGFAVLISGLDLHGYMNYGVVLHELFFLRFLFSFFPVPSCSFD
jgi:hypothetical protein